MRIQNNLAAMNAHRVMGSNTTNTAKSLEKLSSGFRINRAGDDAAGLAISEKMRAQIKGLETAQKNANDGISLVQTAEGALTEVHSMLNRMTELATQSANGTYDDGVDRANLQKEIQSLKSEIDRISDSTNYNGIKLLDGSLSSKASTSIADKEIIEGMEKLEGASKSSVAATSGTYEIKLNMSGAQTAGETFLASTAVAKQLEFNITDTNGTTHTLKYKVDPTAGDQTFGDLVDNINTLLTGGLPSAGNFYSDNKDAIDALKNVFTSIKIQETGTSGTELTVFAESKATGSNAVGLKSMTIKERDIAANGTMSALADYSGNAALGSTAQNAATTRVAADAYTKLTPTALTAGSKITVGDHTFELKAANDYDILKGNIRVVVGSNDTETKDNLVEAMKSAGISSASLTSDGNIKIGDLEQLKTADKEITFNSTFDIKSASLGVGLDVKDAVNATFTFAAVAATDVTTSRTFGINYTDADGNTKALNVDYIGGATADSTAESIVNAINQNDTMRGLFKATNNAGTITLEALGGKDSGVTVNTVATTDPVANAVSAIAKDVEATRSAKTVEVTNSGIAKGDVVSVGGKDYQFIDAADAGDPTKVKTGATAVIIGADSAATAKNLQNALANDGVKAALTGSKLTIEDGEKISSNTGGLTLQVGETSDSFQKVTVAVESMGTEKLGIKDINVATQQGAAAAMDKIKEAINTVSSTRGDLGAIQNRLEHTMNNLGVAQENMTAAESRIRDVDMAKEMMNFTKNNILVQASQAMLAQANQQPQGVLQLLR